MAGAAPFLRASPRGVAGRRLGAECGRRGGSAAGTRLATGTGSPRPRALSQAGVEAAFVGAGPRGSPGTSRPARGRECARAPRGSCSDGDGVRAHEPGASAARGGGGAAPGRVGGAWETLARGALGRLAEARNSRLFQSTSGGRGWGLGLGRSPCGTAWRSPSLGTPRL